MCYYKSEFECALDSFDVNCGMTNFKGQLPENIYPECLPRYCIVLHTLYIYLQRYIENTSVAIKLLFRRKTSKIVYFVRRSVPASMQTVEIPG